MQESKELQDGIFRAVAKRGRMLDNKELHDIDQYVQDLVGSLFVIWQKRGARLPHIEDINQAARQANVGL